MADRLLSVDSVTLLPPAAVLAALSEEIGGGGGSGNPGEVAGSSARFWGLYTSYASLPASGSGQAVGDFALFMVD